jgi:predicted RNase H-like nuclease
MARKRYKPKEIVAKLRQVDVLLSQGQNMVDAIRQSSRACAREKKYACLRLRRR